MNLHGLLVTVRESVVAAAAAAGAIVAVKGLSAWKRQLRGKTEYEVGLKVLRAFYRLRDAISLVRHPFMSGGEMAYALKEKQKRDGTEKQAIANPDENRNATAAAYEVRWRFVNEAMSDLQVAIIESEVLWGQEIINAIAPLRKCVTELTWALREYLNRDVSRELSQGDREFRQKIHNIIFWRSEDNNKDPFTGTVNSSVKMIEDMVRPRLK